MPVYEYNALDKKGKTVSGIMDAESATAARQKLRGQGIFPVAIKEAIDSAPLKKYRFFPLTGALIRVRASEIALTTRQLATLVGAGFPLVSALDTLIPQTKSHSLKKTLAKVKDSILGGNSFSGALTPYAGIFSPLYINMIRAGESSGTLDIVLDRLADLTEKQEALKSKINSALAYPVFMALVGAAVLFFLMSIVVPNITGIFAEMKQNLPAPTLFLIGISNFLKSYGWLAIPLVIVATAGIRSFRKTRKGRRFIDKAALKIPGIGPMLCKLSVARFSRTLASLLEKRCVHAHRPGNRQKYRRKHPDHRRHRSRSHGGRWPTGSIHGGEQGVSDAVHPDDSSGRAKRRTRNHVEQNRRRFRKGGRIDRTRITSLLEPVMILVMGVAVGLIVLSICLPIFERCSASSDNPVHKDFRFMQKTFNLI